MLVLLDLLEILYQVSRQVDLVFVLSKHASVPFDEVLQQLVLLLTRLYLVHDLIDIREGNSLLSTELEQCLHLVFLLLHGFKLLL